MKFLKGSALLVSMGLLFGTASAVGGTIEVKAADETIPEGFRLEYLRISDELYEDWTSRGTGLYVHWWGGTITAPDGSNEYAVGEEIGDTDIHPLYVPADSTGFLLYNGNWGSKNQTVDVSLSKLDDAYDRVAALDSLGTTMYYDSAIVYEVTGNTINWKTFLLIMPDIGLIAGRANSVTIGSWGLTLGLLAILNGRLFKPPIIRLSAEKAILPSIWLTSTFPLRLLGETILPSA